MASPTASNTNVLLISNSPDKCAKKRMVYSTNLDFSGGPGAIEISVTANNRSLSNFELVRGMFFSIRARTDGSGLKPWFRITVADSGQFWDVGTENDISPWHTQTVQFPVFMSASGRLRIEMIQGEVASKEDCVIILTNWDVEPYSLATSTDNEVG